MSCPNVAAAPSRSQESARWLDPLELGVLGAIWGASFLFMRVAANDFGPAPLVEVRLALGSLVLLPFLWRDRSRFPLRLWPKLALIGAINSALPFLLFAWAAQRAPAGIGAIANAMTVLFTALVGFLFFGERIGTRRALALVVGFVGVVVLASGKAAGMSIGAAAAAGALASLLYGLGINLVRRHLGGLPPAAVASATLGSAALLTLPVAIATWPVQPLPAAIQELLGLDERFFGQSGLYNALAASDLRILNVQVIGGQATVELLGTYRVDDVCDIPRVREQLRRTALQFEGVNEVIVVINGGRL